VQAPEPEPPPPPVIAPSRQRVLAMAGGDDDLDPTEPRSWGKVPRNAPCPCGSGKKYKQCHGRLA